MLDTNLVRENPEKVKNGVAKKNVDPTLVDRFLDLDIQWRDMVQKLDTLKARQNVISKEVQNNPEKKAQFIEDGKDIKHDIQALEPELKDIAKERERILGALPNLPLEGVPTGKNDRENVVAREVGEKRKFDFQPKDYLTIAERLGIIDVERAGKVSGSRFGYLKGDAALLEFRLVQLAMRVLTDPKNVNQKPFVPVVPPVLVKPEMMRAMGYVERGGDEIYHLEKDDLYLVGTSEQSMGPMHTNEVFGGSQLPLRYVGFSTCFRREAGSYGKDTKGILRVHQFDKVEMFSFTKPEDSVREHAFLLSMEEKLMQELQIPYRVVNICTGDLGDPAAAKYDIEAWMPGQNEGKGEYRETHSTSNTTDFQARRLNIRYRSTVNGQKSKVDYVHMLNGTAFAIGRMIIAILENYQKEDGTFEWPKALKL